MTKQKCPICDRRPINGNGRFCGICSDKLAGERRRSRSGQPQKFLTYRGHVVGLYRNGGGNLSPRLLKRTAKYLPQCRTLDLNTYLDGFSRDKIKTFKRCILSLAAA